MVRRNIQGDLADGLWVRPRVRPRAHGPAGKGVHGRRRWNDICGLG